MALTTDPDTPPAPLRSTVPVTGPSDKALRYARTCYDHLAGQLAVEMTDCLIKSGRIELSSEGGALTDEGDRFLRSLGVDLMLLAIAHRVEEQGGCFAALVWTGAKGGCILAARSGRPYANAIWITVGFGVLREVVR